MAQYWFKPKGTFNDSLQCRVNGRRTYWAGKQPIPGGISYENFEFREPYQDGREYWFGYTTQNPTKEFGFPYDATPMAASKRIISDSEKRQAEQAKLIGRSFTKVTIQDGLNEWKHDGDDCFHVENRDGKPFVTSKGRKGKGRVYQCF